MTFELSSQCQLDGIAFLSTLQFHPELQQQKWHRASLQQKQKKLLNMSEMIGVFKKKNNLSTNEIIS